jgi:hypothetical protein
MDGLCGAIVAAATALDQSSTTLNDLAQTAAAQMEGATSSAAQTASNINSTAAATEELSQGRPDAFPRPQWNVPTKFPRTGAESRRR